MYLMLTASAIVFVHADSKKNRLSAVLFASVFSPYMYPTLFPLWRPCLLSSGHKPQLRASGALWLSINSGVWSISLQLLQKNWAQRAMFKPWLGLVFYNRSFFFFLFYSGRNVKRSLLNWPDRPHANTALCSFVYHHISAQNFPLHKHKLQKGFCFQRMIYLCHSFFKGVVYCFIFAA